MITNKKAELLALESDSEDDEIETAEDVKQSSPQEDAPGQKQQEFFEMMKTMDHQQRAALHISSMHPMMIKRPETLDPVKDAFPQVIRYEDSKPEIAVISKLEERHKEALQVIKQYSSVDPTPDAKKDDPMPINASTNVDAPHPLPPQPIFAEQSAPDLLHANEPLEQQPAFPMHVNMDIVGTGILQGRTIRFIMHNVTSNLMELQHLQAQDRELFRTTPLQQPTWSAETLHSLHCMQARMMFTHFISRWDKYLLRDADMIALRTLGHLGNVSVQQRDEIEARWKKKQEEKAPAKEDIPPIAVPTITQPIKMDEVLPKEMNEKIPSEDIQPQPIETKENGKFSSEPNKEKKKSRTLLPMATKSPVLFQKSAALLDAMVKRQIEDSLEKKEAIAARLHAIIRRRKKKTEAVRRKVQNVHQVEAPTIAQPPPELLMESVKSNEQKYSEMSDNEDLVTRVVDGDDDDGNVDSDDELMGVDPSYDPFAKSLPMAPSAPGPIDIREMATMIQKIVREELNQRFASPPPPPPPPHADLNGGAFEEKTKKVFDVHARRIAVAKNLEQNSEEARKELRIQMLQESIDQLRGGVRHVDDASFGNLPGGGASSSRMILTEDDWQNRMKQDFKDMQNESDLHKEKCLKDRDAFIRKWNGRFRMGAKLLQQWGPIMEQKIGFSFNEDLKTELKELLDTEDWKTNMGRWYFQHQPKTSAKADLVEKICTVLITNLAEKPVEKLFSSAQGMIVDQAAKAIGAIAEKSPVVEKKEGFMPPAPTSSTALPSNPLLSPPKTFTPLRDPPQRRSPPPPPPSGISIDKDMDEKKSS